MKEAITLLILQKDFRKVLNIQHFEATPDRVVKAYEEYFSGVDRDPVAELSPLFENDVYSQMVVLADVDFVSHCAHHFSPFIGTYTFAYIPNKHLVGLSKVPRMVEILCSRPQVQENLANDIVLKFHNTVEPKGCGIIIDAVHTCACIRGVKKKFTTRTTALAGCFHEAAVKAEFMQSVKVK